MFDIFIQIAVFIYLFLVMWMTRMRLFIKRYKNTYRISQEILVIFWQIFFQFDLYAGHFFDSSKQVNIHYLGII